MLRGAVVLAGFLAILVALFTRTLGIHVDELNYMAWAKDSPVGDAMRTGKPAVFYLFNYTLYGLVPDWAEGLRPLILHLFYAALGVFSIAWLAAKAATTTEAFVWQFVILLCTPFFVFNTTQLMMESAVLPMLALTMAGLMEFDRHASGLHASLLVLASATCALLFKETAAPALIVLLVAFWPRWGRRLWPLPVALAIGFGVTALMQSILGAPAHDYGGLTSFLDLGSTSSRLARTWPYTWTWIFFVGPFALAAVLFLRFARGLLRNPDERALLRVGALSLLATFLIQLVSQNLFVRYAYPVIWIGLIAFALLLLRGPRWLALMLVALSCLPIVNMWSAHSARLDLWPSLVTREAHYSAYTILPGVPNLGWLAIAGDGRHNTCIFVPQQDAQFPELIRRYFATVTVVPRFFDEHELDAFRRCPGPRAIVRRQFQVQPALCQPDCSEPEFSINVCSLQEMRSFPARQGQILTNRTCLP